MTQATPQTTQQTAKPKGLNKLLHAVGKGLKVSGEALIRIALSNLGAMNNED